MSDTANPYQASSSSSNSCSRSGSNSPPSATDSPSVSPLQRPFTLAAPSSPVTGLGIATGDISLGGMGAEERDQIAHERLAPPRARATTLSDPRARPQPAHEIQPPIRRLSAHQILLLTPFGNPSAVAAAVAAANGGIPMGRAPSSHGGGPSTLASTGVSMAQTRSRYASGPGSFLRPLATIRSETAPTCSQSATLQRNPSSISGAMGDESSSQIPLPSTVPMLRSNSVPVLSLAELEILKNRDAEMGISRAREFAWVASAEDEADDVTQPMTAGPSSSTGGASAISLDPQATSSTASVTASSTPSSPRRMTYTAFSDPFASSSNTPNSTLITTSPSTTFAPPSYVPSSTSPGYRYNPLSDSRRASENPSGSGPSNSPFRSARYSPTNLQSTRPELRYDQTEHRYVNVLPSSTRQSFTSFSSSAFNPSSFTYRPGVTPPARTSGESERSASANETSPQPSETQLSSSPSSPRRPGITRYRTSPARFSGLGLDVVLRNSDIQIDEPRSSVTSNASRTTGGTRVNRGNWATLDVVESRELAGSAPSTPSGTSPRNGVILPVSVAPRSQAHTNALGAGPFVDGFLGQTPATLTHRGSDPPPTRATDHSFGHWPWRRGSLAVLGERAALIPWIVRPMDGQHVRRDERRGGSE